MRMMVVFEKGRDLRFIGHLDLMRAMQRALRRSGLPIRYSNGFNPHIRLSFAAPLSVGVAGLRELMEVPVEDGVTERTFTDAMNAALPACLQVRECQAVEDGFPTLMSLVAGSRYVSRFAQTPEAKKAVGRLDDFMSLGEYIAVRRTKSGEKPCDIRPFVANARIEEDGESGGEFCLTLETLQTGAGALKPSLWLRCLCAFAGAEPFDFETTRTAILGRNSKGILVPLEELADG